MENFVVAVESRNDGDKNGNDDKVFLGNEKHKHDKRSRSYKFDRRNNSTKAERDGKRSNIKCYKCGQHGHIQAQCKKNNDETVASAFDAVDKHMDNDAWILDSGVSSHMCRL